MAERINTSRLSIISGTKEEQYEALLPQIKGLLTGEDDLIANLGNVAAALKEQFGWLWVGFYLVKKQQLVLGPFQGPVACTRIALGRGVCGKSWQEKTPLIVADVNQFPDHISCSSLSKSEIVIPVLNQERVVAVLDIDSSLLNDFNQRDQYYLQKILGLLHFGDENINDIADERS